MDPAGFVTAINAVNEHVLSAQPGAPVVPEPPPKPARLFLARKAAAISLRRLADRLEPAMPPRACEATRGGIA